MKIQKILLWIVVGAIGVAVIVAVFNTVKKNVFTVAENPTGTGGEMPVLTDESPVVITLEDGLYHLPNCKKISGVKEKVVYGAAKLRDVDPCPFCIGEP
ncbi:MAG: hypothetical protein FJY65_04735 [Calditrichaeota bacterium]|nr:hypothetical protein [Calditrichota bacterium]